MYGHSATPSFFLLSSSDEPVPSRKERKKTNKMANNNKKKQWKVDHHRAAASHVGDGDAAERLDNDGAWTKVQNKKLQKKKSARVVASSSSSSSTSSGHGHAREKRYNSTDSTGSHSSNNSSGSHGNQGKGASVAPNYFSWRVPNSGKNVPQQQSKEIPKSSQVNSKESFASKVVANNAHVDNKDNTNNNPVDPAIQSKVNENEREMIRLKIWNILFRNVNRTIDELYYMCEFDSSEEHCEKAEELLETYLADFRELKNRIQAQKEFETLHPNSPRHVKNKNAQQQLESSKGLAWEVRKSNASPSPVTLLFGSRLREFDTEESPFSMDIATGGKYDETILKRRSLKELSFSSKMVNKEWVDHVKSTAAAAPGIPSSSAWVKKPNLSKHNEKMMEAKSADGEADKVVNLRLQGKPSSANTSSFLQKRLYKANINLVVDDDDDDDDDDDEQEELMSVEVPETDSVAEPVLSGTSTPSHNSCFDEVENHQHSSDDDEEDDASKKGTVFNFDHMFGGSSLRWGDESVGLTAEALTVLEPASPKRKYPCIACGRYVLPKKAENSACSACQSRTGSSAIIRSLHEKLSSPERRKPSPSETKRRQSEKQATARLNREKIDLQRQAKLRLQSSRQEQVAKTKEECILAQERAISERLERAAVAREAQLKSVAKKAENESLKVNEVQFINELTELEKTAQFRKKLEDGEKRRMEFIGTIREKAEKQSERAHARKLREEDKERQLREAMQRRHEEAEKRKAEAMEEQRRKLDGMSVEASKVNERRTEMEKEREARLALIKEREERAEQERMKHLLAKRSLSSSRCSATTGGDGRNSPSVFNDLVDDDANASLPATSSGICASNTNTMSDFNSVEDAMESTEEHQARVAEEENRFAQELQQKEKHMKKKARKVRSKIASMCGDAMHVPVTSCGKQVFALKRASKPIERTRALELITKLAREGKLVYEDLGTEFFDILVDNICSVDQTSTPPRDTELALEILAQICYDCEDVVKQLVFRNKIVPIIDLCVQFLRNPIDSRTSNALIGALKLLRVVLGTGIGSGSQLELINVELVRLCIYSSLILRVSERCAQIKCGERYNKNRANGCSPAVIDAINLVRNSLGLLEALTAIVYQHGANKTTIRNTPVGALFLDCAENSLLFRIVSQLVAAFIAVEELYEERRPSSASSSRSDFVRRNLEGSHPAIMEALRVAARSGLRALNLIACMDINLVQNILGSPALPFELQQLFRYILDACCDKDRQLPNPPEQRWGELSKRLIRGDTCSYSELFAEVVVLMGFYAQSNEKNQESLNWGRSPTPLTRLCCVPFPYFSSPIGKSILFPTLMSIACNNSRALNIIAEEVSPQLLSAYLTKKIETPSPSGNDQRFPKHLWQDALHFLNREQT